MNSYDLQALGARLLSHADEKYRRFNESLTPGAEGRSIGVRMPVLRKLAKEILSDDPAAFLEASLRSNIHEMNLLHALVLAGAELSPEARLAALERFVPTVNNWAVCDVLCGALKPDEGEKEFLLPFIRRCAASEHEFVCRFGVVMLMLSYRDDAHIDETLRLYSAFRHEGYYARMGVAWGLSFLFVDHRERTLAFLRNDPLDDFTHNKAIRKIIESFRVSDGDKALVRTLLRKRR